MSQTAPQVYLSTIDLTTGQLAITTPQVNWLKTLRTIISHPTIKIARFLSIAPAVIRQWSTEGDAPKEVHDHIAKYIIPHRVNILRDALLGMIDWGWVSFECLLDNEQRFAGFKHLLWDLTTLVVDPDTGDLTGIFQNATQFTQQVTLYEPDCITFYQNVWGQEWYGRGDVIDAKLAYDQWTAASDMAGRYDAKVAGAHWVVHYPPGVSLIDGVETDNGLIAQKLLGQLKSSGTIAIPRAVQAFVDAANAGAEQHQWKIEILESSANTSSGIDTRLRYLDMLMVRAFCMTERSLQEGQHGTKAEAETHADVAIAYIDMRLQHVISRINKIVVDSEIARNFGPQYVGRCVIIPEPMDADKRTYLQGVYDKILSTPEGFMDQLDDIDINALREISGVPTKSAVNNRL